MTIGQGGATTVDAFLGGRLKIRQPSEGYRAGIDPVMLAAAVAPKPGDRVLDLGCGVGTAALCLLARVADVSVVGLEVQPELAPLARQNAEDNGLAERFLVAEGSVAELPEQVALGRFDHVITNPPWLSAAVGRAPATASKAIGHVEGEVDLVSWLKVAVGLLAPKGRLTLIHRADRLGDVLGGLARLPVGGVRIMPLWPRAGRAAIRVIVSARKGVRTAPELLPGLVLHGADNRYTEEADRILRDAGALV